jgi:hypothetical protein
VVQRTRNVSDFNVADAPEKPWTRSAVHGV